MNIEQIKNEFIKLKKEELEYLDNISKISSEKILTELEKLEIYRTFNSYEVKLINIIKKLREKIIKNKKLLKNYLLNDVIIEFDIKTDFLSSLNNDEDKKYIFNALGINLKNYKFELILYDLIYRRNWYCNMDLSIIQHKQTLSDKPIYIFRGYYDYAEDCYGPAFGDDYIYGIYENIYNKSNKYEEVPEKSMNDFEKDKTIIHHKKYVKPDETKNIFKEELLNAQNKSLNDCVIQTRKRIEELNYIKSPEYKEKILLEKINALYQKVKGGFITKEVLYKGDFLTILREIYKLPNENIVKKEKIVKNNGKNSVIIIAITQDKEYIITFQNRIKDKLIAEFPSGYIENDEDVITTAKRELQEETGFTSDDLFIIDEAYTSPGIDNSITYIVVANNCIKTDKKQNGGTELVNHGLFLEIELSYLIYNNIMNGAMNKLAYYNLINNVDNCDIHILDTNQKIYKRLRKKKNPLEN